MFYKIVDEDKPGIFKTLFHGINGSRVLQFNEWLEADLKMVKDGTSKTKYLSGWHIMEDLQECTDYLRNFKHLTKKRIVACEAKHIWPKSHSRSNVWLSQYIKITGVCGE